MKTTDPMPTDIRKMAKDYRAIRSAQPSLTSAEMMAQVRRNRLECAERSRLPKEAR
jgi:hypothetical protein